MSSHPNTTTSSSNTTTAGAKTDSAIADIKSGLKGIHGIGETIRGTFNSAVDQVFNEPTGEAKNRAIAAHGDQEIRGAEATVNKYRGNNSATGTSTSTGVTTGGVSASGIPQEVDGQGEAGTHAVPVGNLGDDGMRSGTTTTTQGARGV